MTQLLKGMNLTVLMWWMNLEPIIQSEVSQKEKDKYHLLAHIYDNLELWDRREI